MEKENKKEQQQEEKKIMCSMGTRPIETMDVYLYMFEKIGKNPKRTR